MTNCAGKLCAAAVAANAATAKINATPWKRFIIPSCLSSSDNNIPGPHLPVRNQSIRHIRIVPGETLYHSAVADAKHEQGAVRRIAERAGHHDFAAFECNSHQLEVLFAKWCPAFCVVFNG